MITLRSLASLAVLPMEYAMDFARIVRWSKASPLSTRATAMFYEIVLLAHTVEKGLSQPVPRPGFGREKILRLLSLLEDYDWTANLFPVRMSMGALSEYVSWHAAKGVELGTLGKAIQYFLTRCAERDVCPDGGTKNVSHRRASDGESVEDFLSGRYSCRRFEDRVVPIDEIRRVVEIAQRAPSQCNRQSTLVHCYRDRADISALLSLQGGAGGFREGVRNLFVITGDMAAWSGSNARNQCFVDGALFSMQLALACNARGLGCCALNLAVGNLRERRIRDVGRIPHSQRLILMLAFGYARDDGGRVTVARSPRLPVSTVLAMHS